MSTPELRALADRLLSELQAKHPLKKPATVEWRPYRVTAGMAYYRVNVIGLSRYVLNEPTAVTETLLHEYAHLMAFEAAGRHGAGHGRPWQTAMLQLGQSPKVRHNYEVKRNEKRQEVGYTCQRCGETFVRSRRLPKRGHYVHARCGGALQLAFIRPRSNQPITEAPLPS